MTTDAITLETGAHVVHFHEDDADLIATVGGYVAATIWAGDVALIMATDAHREALDAYLDAAGIDVAEARRSATFVTLDAATVLAGFYADGQIDAERFRSVIGDAIGQVARRTGRAVRCHGEMVALLWDADAITAAIELEDLWNDLSHELGFSLLCTYPSQSVAGGEHSRARLAVCRSHSDVVDPRDGAVRHFRPQQHSRSDLALEVHQASGIVSVQLGVHPAEALDRLRSFATEHGKTLDNVARDVVNRRLGFNHPEPQ